MAEFVQIKLNNMISELGEDKVKSILSSFVCNENFDVQDFICPQTKRIMVQVQEKYGNQLEYLWEKSPDTAVLRHEGNQKWYAVLMKISWDKLEKGREGQVEAVNLKHDQVADLLSKKGIYPAFHMNKRYWISVALDDTLSDEEVLELIEKSWNLTSKK